MPDENLLLLHQDQVQTSCHQSRLCSHLLAVLLSTPQAATACWFIRDWPLHWRFPATPAAWLLFTNLCLPWADECCTAGTQPVFGDRMNPKVFVKANLVPLCSPARQSSQNLSRSDTRPDHDHPLILNYAGASAQVPSPSVLSAMMVGMPTMCQTLCQVWMKHLLLLHRVYGLEGGKQVNE